MCGYVLTLRWKARAANLAVLRWKARAANLAVLRAKVQDPALRYPPDDELLHQKYHAQLVCLPHWCH